MEKFMPDFDRFCPNCANVKASGFSKCQQCNNHMAKDELGTPYNFSCVGSMSTWFAAIKYTNLTKVKKESIEAARQLGYSNKLIAKINNASTVLQISKIMRNARLQKNNWDDYPTNEVRDIDFIAYEDDRPLTKQQIIESCTNNNPGTFTKREMLAATLR